MIAWQKCPVCNGTGLVSIPPGVAGDQPSFSSSETGPWPCQPCDGKGVVWGPVPDSRASQRPEGEPRDVTPVGGIVTRLVEGYRPDGTEKRIEVINAALWLAREEGGNVQHVANVVLDFLEQWERARPAGEGATDEDALIDALCSAQADFVWQNNAPVEDSELWHKLLRRRNEAVENLRTAITQWRAQAGESRDTELPNVYGLLSQAVKRASDVLDTNGCITGDCPHDTWAGCQSALIGDVSQAILDDPAYQASLRAAQRGQTWDCPMCVGVGGTVNGMCPTCGGVGTVTAGRETKGGGE